MAVSINWGGALFWCPQIQSARFFGGPLLRPLILGNSYRFPKSTHVMLNISRAGTLHEAYSCPFDDPHRRRPCMESSLV